MIKHTIIRQEPLKLSIGSSTVQTPIRTLFSSVAVPPFLRDKVGLIFILSELLRMSVGAQTFNFSEFDRFKFEER